MVFGLHPKQYGKALLKDSMLLKLSFEIFKMGYKLSFFIKNNAEDLDSSTTGIGDPYKYKTESSCNLGS